MKVALIVLALFWLALIGLSWAEAAEPVSAGDLSAGSEAPPSAQTAGEFRGNRSPSGVSSDEYSFNWLDPEKKIYVLQNRRYIKAERLLLSAMVGPGISNSYRSTFSVEGRMAYYFKEVFGIEAFYAFISNKENNTFEALKLAAPNTLPVVREIRNQYGVLVHYVPWYAKINVFNNILYFDWYFTGGVGTLHAANDTRSSAAAAPTYAFEDLFAVFAGTGHQYHISHDLTVRLDFTGAFYRAPIGGATSTSALFSNYTFGAGLGLRI